MIAELKNIWFRYDEQSPWILEELDFSLKSGERVCITGDNGSGKSTLAKIIAGLASPDFGEVELIGKKCFCKPKTTSDTSSLIEETQQSQDFGVNVENYSEARKQIACVFQNPADQIITESVAGDIAFVPQNLCFSTQEIDEAVAKQLEKAGLRELAGKDPSTLSGGEQQLTVLASAIAASPKLLVLDEPTAYLDAENSQHFSRLLEKLPVDMAVINITHKTSEIKRADRIIELKRRG